MTTTAPGSYVGHGAQSDRGAPSRPQSNLGKGYESAGELGGGAGEHLSI